MPLPAVAYRLIGRFSIMRFTQVLHPILYRWTGGRGILGRVLGSEMLVLTTTGRRSGRARNVALFCFAVAIPVGSWAVIGSRGGSGKLPAWYHNMRANPRASIQFRGQVVPVRPREVFGEEYEALFESAASVYPGYRLYRAEATHHIPIVVLEPEGAPVDREPTA
jgi:deazaflavin-dependent oxidoreductase (nitroreductase family)